MGYNAQDSFNLNRSMELFGSIGLDTGQLDEMLTLFPISKMDYGPDAAYVLAEAMMSAMRFDQSMNLWVDIQTDFVPGFVVEAIRKCEGFKIRLVVTHGAASSHPPGSPLSAQLLQVISDAAVSDEVWHPRAKRLVPSIAQ